MRFACRMCRDEVIQDIEGTFNHVRDGSPACIVTLADGTPLPDWDRHEKVELSSSEDVVSQLQAEEDVKS